MVFTSDSSDASSNYYNAARSSYGVGPLTISL